MEISRAFCSEGDAVRQDGTAAPSGRNIRCRQNRRLPGGKGGMLRRRAFLRSEIIKIRLSYSDGYFIFGSETGSQRYPLWSACRLVSAIFLRNNGGSDFFAPGTVLLSKAGRSGCRGTSSGCGCGRRKKPGGMHGLLHVFYCGSVSFRLMSVYSHDPS